MVNERQNAARTLAVAAMCLVSAGLLAFLPPYFARQRGQNLAQEFLRTVEANRLRGAPTGSAQIQSRLLRESLEVREEFLAAALATGANAATLAEQRQGWMVALSQVRFADATALSKRILLPRLFTSEEEGDIRQAVYLMDQWDFAQMISESDRNQIMEQISERLTVSKSQETAEALASVLPVLLPNKGSIGNKGVLRLISRLGVETNGHILGTIGTAIATLEPRLEEKGTREVALKLAALIEAEQGATRLTVEAFLFAPLAGRLSVAESSRLAAALIERVPGSLDPVSLRAICAVLQSVSPRMDSASADAVSMAVRERMEKEIGAKPLNNLAQALGASAQKVSADQFDQLLAWLMDRMELPFPELAAALPAVFTSTAVRMSPLQLGEAGRRLLARLETEKDDGTIESLGRSLAAVKTGVDTLRADRAVATFWKRISQGDVDDLEILALLLDRASGKQARAVASLLAQKVATEPDGEALTSFAKVFLQLAGKLSEPEARTIADRFLVRMSSEQDADKLRTLAFCMGALSERAPKRIRENAGHVLARKTVAEANPQILRAMVSALLALGAGPNAGDFNLAATQLALRIKLEEDRLRRRNLAESLHALQGHISEDVFRDAATDMIREVLRPENEAVARSLASGLDLILPELNPAAAADLAAQVLARTGQGAPDFLFVLAEILAELPAHNLTQSDLARYSKVLGFPGVSCGVALRTAPDIRRSAIADQLLNPACSAESWTSLAAALGNLEHQPIVTVSGSADQSFKDYFHRLVVADDEDDDSEQVASGGQWRDVNFEKLSQALDPLRPAPPSNILRLALVAAFLLATAGLAGVALELRRRSSLRGQR